VEQDESAQRAATLLLTVGGAAGIVLGALLSPATLIRLGPMRTSLQSSIDSVQVVAEWEVFLARLALAGAGLLAVLAGLSWRRLVRSSPVLRVQAHDPLATRSPLSWRSLLGGPLWVLLGVCTLGLAFTLSYARLPSGWAVAIGSEDGVIELATALSFLVAAGISARVAWGPAPPMRRAVHLGLALGFVLCCGEEISWGQRLFGFETPEGLQGLNVQNEANLHNLAGYAADHLFIALVAGYGVLLPILVARFEWVHKLTDLLGLPIASLPLAAGFAIASLIHDWSVYRVLPRGDSWFRLAELRELLSALGLALLMLEAWRLVSKPTPPETAPET